MGIQEDYMEKTHQEIMEIFDSPIRKLGKHYGKNADYNGIIGSLVRSCYDKAELRELSKSTCLFMLHSLVEKRLKELSNAECFIMQIPD